MYAVKIIANVKVLPYFLVIHSLFMSHAVTCNHMTKSANQNGYRKHEARIKILAVSLVCKYTIIYVLHRKNGTVLGPISIVL